MRLSPRSLKYRLLLAFLLGLVGIEAAASYFGYRLIERHSWEEFDRYLLDKLRFYRTTVSFPKGRLSWRMGEADWDRVSNPEDPDYFQFRFADGRSLPKPEGGTGWSGRSGSLSSQDLPMLGKGGEGPEFASVTLPGELEGRAVGQEFAYQWVPAGGDPAQPQTVKIHVAAARSSKATRQTLRQIRVLMWEAGAAATLGVLATAFLIIRRNVRPVGELETQIATMPLDDPGRRFSLPDAPSEIDTVVGRLNALMDRVAAALEHERQFTSQAAHELRTPLAGMRSQIELALQRQRTPEQYEETLLRLQEIQQKLQNLTDNLLLLARLESGQKEFGQSEELLGKLLRRSWKPYFDAAADRELKVTWKVKDPPLPLLLPAPLLEIVLRNVYENAVAYTPVGGTIEITGQAADGRCCFSVWNSDPGVNAEQLSQLFRPFWRGDQSADPNLKRAGIGLALCRRILTTLHGEITARLESGRVAVEWWVPLPEVRPAAGSPAGN